MQTQEIITLITRLPKEIKEPVVKKYPELNSLLNNGMYIESCQQTLIADDRYILTFIFKYLNQHI